jgi:hypothetical protein
MRPVTLRSRPSRLAATTTAGFVREGFTRAALQIALKTPQMALLARRRSEKASAGSHVAWVAWSSCANSRYRRDGAGGRSYHSRTTQHDSVASDGGAHVNHFLGLSWTRHIVSAGVVVLAACAAAGCKGESTDDDAPSAGTGGGGGSGGSGGSGSGAAPIAAADYADAFSKAYCALGPCCQHEGYAFTQASCEAAAKALMDTEIRNFLSEPGVAFDETAAGACAAAIRKSMLGCTDRTLQDAATIPCSELFYGTVQEGGACTVDSACAPIAGVSAVACNSGECGPSVFLTTTSDTPGKAGDSCNATCKKTPTGVGCESGGVVSGQPAPQLAAACHVEDGLYCTAQYVCAPLPKRGEACSGYCATDSYCDTGSVCVAANASGACQSSDMCVHTSYCDNDTNQCTPLKANGMACKVDSACSSWNCDDDTCHEWSVATASSCAVSFN